MNGVPLDLSRYSNAPRGLFLPRVIDGVVPNDVSRETAPPDTVWEAPSLEDFTDEQWEDLSDAEKRRIAGHYAWAKAMPPAAFGDLKFPHHRASDGKVVKRGVDNAMARIDQSDIPQADKGRVRAHLESHQRQFDENPSPEAIEQTPKDLLEPYIIRANANKNKARR